MNKYSKVPTRRNRRNIKTTRSIRTFRTTRSRRMKKIKAMNFRKINIKTIKNLQKKFKNRQQIGCSMKGGTIFQAGLDVKNQLSDTFTGGINSFMGNNQIPTSNVIDQPNL